jgi:hypothetical protein
MPRSGATVIPGRLLDRTEGIGSELGVKASKQGVDEATDEADEARSYTD